ncbi:hypothetical protein [Kitasatospora sp. LaBMicrA B282]|uniref:hypothetical protein n=1 Tax=Kitasatospora sp. LaBMicrA B282 TaxID=3420949 RepID=UPI003D09CFC3
MLVEVEKIAKFPWSPVLAQVRTAFGRTSVRWCGDPGAEPGEYHVEWTVEEDLAWGRNAKSAVGSGPEIRQGGHGVVLRGRLSTTEDGAAVLQLGDALILLDLATPVPGGAVDTWIELRVEREKIALYPYRL